MFYIAQNGGPYKFSHEKGLHSPLVSNVFILLFYYYYCYYMTALQVEIRVIIIIIIIIRARKSHFSLFQQWRNPGTVPRRRMRR